MLKEETRGELRGSFSHLLCRISHCMHMHPVCPASPRVLDLQRAGAVGVQKSANNLGLGSSFAHR